jgi:uncharacterized membrane protein
MDNAPHSPVSEVMKQFMPWTVTGFVIMVISGVLLFTAIPVRTYQSVFFRGKLLMLLLAGVNVWVFHSTIYRNLAAWDLDNRSAQARPHRRMSFLDIVGRHCHHRPDDRLQLV